MTEIKLITRDTDFEELNICKLDWDVVIPRRMFDEDDAFIGIENVPYQVCRIEGYVHTIGGRYGDNDFWMYPLGEKPCFENIVEYNGENGGACFGYRYEPHHYIRTKWDEPECFVTGGVMITRNGEDFYFCGGGITEALWRIKRIKEHPISFHERNFEKELIGRKIWWKSQPGIITSYIKGQACVIIEPDGMQMFEAPPEYEFGDDEKYIKTSVFDEHIWWFRN